MGTILKLLAQMVGFIILAGLALLVLWVVVKLFIILITASSIVVGFALALIIVVGLVVVLFEIIRDVIFGKGKDKNNK